MTEVVVTSDASGLLYSACVWDSHTGTALMNYKGGGVAASRTLCLLGNDYVVCAEKSRPLLHVWPVNSQETAQNIERIVTPGCVGALAVSPNNSFIVFSFGEKLSVWELATGDLMSVPTRHFRQISCIKFTDDCSHFVSSGFEGMVVVWSLAHVISSHQGSGLLQQTEIGHSEPRYVFTDHSLPVTDLFIGRGGIQAIMLSVAGDHTCKMYNLADGILLLSLVFDSALTSVTMNASESDVFVGSVNGNIHHINVRTPPRALDYHLTRDEMAVKFVGHSKAVTCLSASLDGVRLLSGSFDEKVIIWDIESRQCLKIIQHKGPVTNAFFTLSPKHMFSASWKPYVVVQTFKRDASFCNDKPLVYITKEENSEKTPAIKTSGFDQQKETFEEEIKMLKQINRDLYTYSVKNVLDTLNNQD